MSFHPLPDLFATTNNSFKSRLRKAVEHLAVNGIFIGTSSWKYAGWCGLLYDEQRYCYRGKFAESRFERDCLAEYAETCKRRSKSAAGGARKVRHLPARRKRFWGQKVKSGKLAAR